ncbi:hypothetical protein CEXT_612581 [Caerostris extrusa]|uniref:Uncharacterized protein n=1 Tax=Caerostris extrusa TaxID=172846 RepID=A0AAV4V5Z1_CAEEX|nr:hypothetical protein CEXT_612581 [Caerostris extrusa]
MRNTVCQSLVVITFGEKLMKRMIYRAHNISTGLTSSGFSFSVQENCSEGLNNSQNKGVTEKQCLGGTLTFFHVASEAC